MPIHIIDKASGRYEITKDVSKNDLDALAKNPDTSTIQFASPISSKDIHNLEDLVFSKRPDIYLRVYGHYSQECDLNILKEIPSLRRVTADCLINAKGIESVAELKNLESLGVGIFEINNFNFLNDINPSIKKLSLQLTRSKKPKIDMIGRFQNLEDLYLESQSKGIEEIEKLKKLKKLVLRSISTANLNYLSGLRNLWSVDIKLGGIKNFDGLKSLPQLKYLELWQVRELSDLGFISDLVALQNLFIQALRNVERLPSFERLAHLRRIYLENLKGLKDLSSLKNASRLEEFTYVSAENQEPENLVPVLENPTVKSVFCMFGSDKKNNRFKELAEEYGKEQYEFTEFEYR